MRFALLALLASFISLSAHALNTTPLEPILAADQAEINADTLKFEAEQFEALSRWQEAFDLWQMAQTKAELKKQEFLRADKIFKSGYMTLENHTTIKFLYECAQREIIRQAAEMALARTQANVARLNLQHYGNPGKGDLKILVEAMLEQRLSLAEALKSRVESVETEMKLADLRLQGGSHLKKNKIVGQAEVDVRVFNVKNAAERLAALKAQITLTDKAIEASRLAIKALE